MGRPPKANNLDATFWPLLTYKPMPNPNQKLSFCSKGGQPCLTVFCNTPYVNGFQEVRNQFVLTEQETYSEESQFFSYKLSGFQRSCLALHSSQKALVKNPPRPVHVSIQIRFKTMLSPAVEFPAYVHIVGYANRNKIRLLSW